MKAYQWFLAMAMVPSLALGGCDQKKEPEEKPEPTTAPDQGAKAEPGKEGGKQALRFVDDAIAAAGGLDKLKAAGSFTAKVTEPAFACASRRGPQGYIHECRKAEGQDPVLMARGAEQCWDKKGPAVIPCAKDFAATIRKFVMLDNAAMLWPLKEKDRWELKLGEGDLNGKKLDALTVKAKGSEDQGVLLFDRESKRPVRYSCQATLGGQPGELIWDLEWQDVDGVKMPAKVTFSSGGEVFEEGTLGDFKFGPVDDKLFAPPPQVADGTVVETTTPEMTALCATHQGAYDGIAAALEKMTAFMTEQKIRFFGPPMMIYLKSAPAVKDPKKFVTELCLPVSPKVKVDKKSGYAIKPMKPMKAVAMYGVGDVTSHSGEIIDKLMKELKDQKKKPAGPVCQICFNDPKEFPPAQQVFEIVQPVK